MGMIQPFFVVGLPCFGQKVVDLRLQTLDRFLTLAEQEILVAAALLAMQGMVVVVEHLTLAVVEMALAAEVAVGEEAF